MKLQTSCLWIAVLCALSGGLEQRRPREDPQRQLRATEGKTASNTSASVNPNCVRAQPCQCHCDCPQQRVVVLRGSRRASSAAEGSNTSGSNSSMEGHRHTVDGSTGVLGPGPAARVSPNIEAGRSPCLENEVLRADGSCTVVDAQTLRDVSSLVTAVDSRVAAAERRVAAAERSVAAVRGTDCPETVRFRAELVAAHEEQVRVMKFMRDVELKFIRASANTGTSVIVPASTGSHIGTSSAITAREGTSVGKFQAVGTSAEEVQAEGASAEEFQAKAEYQAEAEYHRVHCEWWTCGSVNASEFCGVLCRHEPSCVGFNVDERGSCLWFDSYVPNGEPQCSKLESTKYMKRRLGPVNQTVRVALDRVRSLERSLEMSLDVSAVQNGNVDTQLQNIAEKLIAASRKPHGMARLDESPQMRELNATLSVYTTELGESRRALETWPAARADTRTLVQAESLMNPVVFGALGKTLVRGLEREAKTHESASEVPPECPCVCDCRCGDHV
eukprot:CAMPEP_0194486392 /NCGR_PEP_ID=MMETSP0253-20130528/7059_1 /TAXON_ID=2966 /ORGANISM="Noctiluca scintillans" /LENGTH=502 /DNA_ID=CAMNT_0039326479 /DNA_START=9 /DNA_END=1517 /DNA_ORIENTATION=-